MTQLQKMFCLLAAIGLSACGGGGSSSSGAATPPTTTAPPPATTPPPPPPTPPTSLLTKNVEVFGITISATDAVPDASVLHAANVLAEYLDNDEDGSPDNAAVVDEMRTRNARLIMARDSAELETLSGQITTTTNDQDLLANEVFINGRGNGQFDATYEEVLHLITHVGYHNEYPTTFGEMTGSLIADAMDVARGGQFITVPASYPAGAWYTYDDTTCAYDCQITEYFYWALTSILGAQDFDGRLEQISDEWQLNTAALVQSRDTQVYSLLTDSQFGLPSSLPDGNYAGQAFTIGGSNPTPPPVNSSQTIFGATSAGACRQAGAQEAAACFIVQDNEASMYGVIGSNIGTTVQQMLNANPGLNLITLQNVPGSEDDDANLPAARMIFNAGINTSVTATSMIASGGVDFFLAGVQRSVEPGAQIGVHSWAFEDNSGRTVQGSDLPRNDPEHDRYINYYTDINMMDPSGFYFFTLNAAPASSIHYMTDEEIQRWSIVR